MFVLPMNFFTHALVEQTIQHRCRLRCARPADQVGEPRPSSRPPQATRLGNAGSENKGRFLPSAQVFPEFMLNPNGFNGSDQSPADRFVAAAFPAALRETTSRTIGFFPSGNSRFASGIATSVQWARNYDSARRVGLEQSSNPHNRG